MSIFGTRPVNPLDTMFDEILVAVTRAQDMLHRAKAKYSRRESVADVVPAAKGATQAAEDARVLSIRAKMQQRQMAAVQAAKAQIQTAQRRAAMAAQEANTARRQRQDAEKRASAAEPEREAGTLETG